MRRTRSGNLGNRLKQLREERNLSAAETARSVGVSESTYRDWEYGRQIKGEPYSLLADLFQVSLTELLRGPGHEPGSIAEDLKEMEAIIRRIRAKL